MGLRSILIKKRGLKIDLKIDLKIYLPLCPLPNRSIFQIQESCDLQGRPLDQTLTVLLIVLVFLLLQSAHC